METRKEFLNIPYNERRLLLIVNNEEAKKEKIKELESSKALEVISKALLGAVPIGGLVGFGLALSGAAVKYISSKGKKAKRAFYIATFNEVSGVKFPHKPSTDRIYIASPVATEIYYEATNFHEVVMKHKFNEVVDILQSLGATKITAVYNEESEKRVKAKVGVNEEYKSGIGYQENKASRTYFNGTYKPKHKPFLPEKLYWYDTDTDMKNIVDGRLYRGMESFELEFEVTSDYGITGDLIAILDKAIKINMSSGYKSFKKTYLKITGEFEPI